ncbi:amino acid permease, partial [Streptomyces sp. NPDC059717]
MSRTLFRTKNVEQSIRDTEQPDHALKKTLSALDLTVFGVGVVIGTGIFVLTGKVAKENAGPAVSLAFVVAGVVCALAALCYAEFASTVPVAGSAYTFSYATLGELPAWIIGWDLVLEFTLGTAVVAVGWSGYIRSLLDNAGWHLPDHLGGRDGAHGFGFDILAAALILVLTAILVVGVKLSARVTQLVVAIKVVVVLIVIVAGAFFVTGSNY